MLTNYLKMTWKVLLRRKFFTFISLVGIALTLMVVSVATALLDGELAPQPSEVHAGRTLGIYQLAMVGPQRVHSGYAGYAFLDRVLRGVPGVEAVAIASYPAAAVSYVGERKITSWLRRTDGAYWSILRFDFVEGGPYGERDEAAANPVAVINETTRQRFFGAAPALGKWLEVDGQRFRVVGVVRDVPRVRFVPFADIWVPLSTAKTGAYRRQVVGDLLGLLLARSRADFPAIRREVAARIARFPISDPGYDRLHGGAETFFEAVSRRLFSSGRLEDSHPGRLRAALFVLLVLFLALPALNLVNINLSRILERGPEIGVRKAFGASAWTLTGQFVLENVLVTVAGGLLGLAAAALALAALNHSGLIPYARFTVNPRVFLYGLGVAVFFGLLSGAYPALRMARLHPVEALRGGVR